MVNINNEDAEEHRLYFSSVNLCVLSFSDFTVSILIFPFSFQRVYKEQRRRKVTMIVKTAREVI
jgi:hypothetical protein